MTTATAPKPENSLEQRLQLLIEAVTDYGIFMLDPDGHILSWNSGAQKLKGYTRQEILGRHFSTFYPPESIASGWPQEELRRARLLGRFEDEGWRLRKDGSRFWANVIITALYDDSGELTGYAKVTRDLTERRAHEEELRASEERFRLLVDSVRDYAIFMLDPDGLVQSWNVGAQAINGYQASEIIGRHLSTFYTPEDQRAGKPERELLLARTTGRYEEEGWRVRKDGTLFWANVVVTAIHGPAGDLRGFAKVTRDMSERRRLEELELSSRRMNEFLAMLAHELRNPLAPVRNAVTIMQLESLASPVLRNCRDVIDRQVTHMTRLVDDLLDVGRLTTGKIKLRKELVRLTDVVARSVETVRPIMEARRHTLELEQPDQSIHVQADPTRLAQILQNLLVNAAKFTPQGGRVVLAVQPMESFVNVTVTDNGRGLTPEHLQQIFHLFMQADTGTSAGAESGLGIGLTLARSLTEMHGGSLEATSPGLGLGSTFTVRLPMTHVAAAQAPAGTEGNGDVAAMRVLVIDDNRDSADSATDVLRLLGNLAECAYDGASGVKKARLFRPQMIFLDLAMPSMDGFETLKLLMDAGLANSYFVAMTGFGNADDKQRTRQAGFHAHVTKPVELDVLAALLQEAQAHTQHGVPAPN